MIDNETYLKSLAKLEEKENLHILATENGKIFEKEYRDILQKAKDENKHIFLLFTLSGCDGCNVLKYTIENNKKVKDYLEKYIVLNCDISITKTQLIQKYNLYSYPAYFIIDSNEKILKKKVGCPVSGGPERNFLNWLISST